jgi:hypothetical protein
MFITPRAYAVTFAVSNIDGSLRQAMLDTNANVNGPGNGGLSRGTDIGDTQVSATPAGSAAAPKRNRYSDSLFNNAVDNLNITEHFKPHKNIYMRRFCRMYFSPRLDSTDSTKFDSAGSEIAINGGFSRGTDKDDIPRSDKPVRCIDKSKCNPSFKSLFDHKNTTYISISDYVRTSVSGKLSAQGGALRHSGERCREGRTCGARFLHAHARGCGSDMQAEKEQIDKTIRIKQPILRLPASCPAVKAGGGQLEGRERKLVKRDVADEMVIRSYEDFQQ